MASKRVEGYEEDGDVSGVSDRPDSPIVSDSSEAPGESDVDRIDLERRIGMWIRALDHHVNGACRADERMKPLLKLDISSGVAEDRFMAQLSQHFEATEVGLLARCLCVPLVSIRVGIVSKQGNLLCPTATSFGQGSGQVDVGILIGERKNVRCKCHCASLQRRSLSSYCHHWHDHDDADEFVGGICVRAATKSLT